MCLKRSISGHDFRQLEGAPHISVHHKKLFYTLLSAFSTCLLYIISCMKLFIEANTAYSACSYIYIAICYTI